MRYDETMFRVRVDYGGESLSDATYVVSAGTAREAVTKVLTAKPGLDGFTTIRVEELGGELID